MDVDTNNRKKKLWILSFEYGPAKVGGLGEVPTNHVRHLQELYDITVFSPVHGLLDEQGSGWSIKPDGPAMSFRQEFAPLKASPREKTFLKGVPDSHDVEVQRYLLQQEGISARVFLLGGLDVYSRRVLDDPVVYNMGGLRSKIALFSNAFLHVVRDLAKTDPAALPDVVHVHDYHPMPAMIAARQYLLENAPEQDFASIYTVHLLTGPLVDKEYLGACGVGDVSLPVYIRGRGRNFTMKRLLKISGGRLEFASAIVADLVTSVSRNYLEKSVIPSCGGGLLTGKVDFMYNGCDWDHDKIRDAVISTHGPAILELNGKDAASGITREDMRRYLLTRLLGSMPVGEPIIGDASIKEIINHYKGKGPYIGDGRVKPFPETGRLALLTGRASKQKGVDFIMDCIPEIVEQRPDVRFLFLLIPTQGELDLVSYFIERSLQEDIQDHLRIVFGKAPSIFHLSHLAADIYLGVSSWEPFGIMVLEAHALGLPVIGTRVGGIQESVIDIIEDPAGTGFLIEKGDEKTFISRVLDAMMLASLSDHVREHQDEDGGDWQELVAGINDKKLRALAQKDPMIYDRMRENARERVEKHFRWKTVSRKEISLVERALNNHDVATARH